MNFIYYDSRLMGGKRQGRKKPDSREIISLSSLTNRIYVTLSAVDRLNLKVKRFSLVQDIKDKQKVYAYVDTKNGFELVNHRYCFYVNSKETVLGIKASFPNDEEDVLEFRIDDSPVRIDGKVMYRLWRISAGEGEDKAKLMAVQRATKAVEHYKQHDFPGRIKTREMLQHEIVLQNLRT